MRGKLLFSLFICGLISVVLCDTIIKPKQGLVEIQPIEDIRDGDPVLVNGMLYKTFKKYYCRLFDSTELRKTLLYGNEGWRFRQQDVNLTLTYPTADMEVRLDKDYLITGYQVILFTDGVEGHAFIGSGGMMEDNISLTFINRGISTLSYQFWLYGARRSRITPSDRQRMC